MGLPFKLKLRPKGCGLQRFRVVLKAVYFNEEHLKLDFCLTFWYFLCIVYSGENNTSAATTWRLWWDSSPSSLAHLAHTWILFWPSALAAQTTLPTFLSEPRPDGLTALSLEFIVYRSRDFWGIATKVISGIQVVDIFQIWIFCQIAHVISKFHEKTMIAMIIRKKKGWLCAYLYYACTIFTENGTNLI